MQSLWSDSDAEAMVAHYRAAGISEDVVLRVYTSRLLGGDPRLVLHGGGNTSVKTTVFPDGDSSAYVLSTGECQDRPPARARELPRSRFGDNAGLTLN